MLKNKYYYIVAGLQDLVFDINKNAVSFSEFKTHLFQLLEKSDVDLINLILMDIDKKNLINILTGKSLFLEGGVFTKSQLETFIKEPLNYNELINEPSLTPNFMKDIIQKASVTAEPLEETYIEKELNIAYIEYLSKKGSKFLKDWTEFEYNLKNVIIALSCRKYGMPIESNIILKNSLSERLSKSKEVDFEISEEFPQIERLIKAVNEENIVQLEKVIDTIRWEKVMELTNPYFFSIEIILSYFIRLQIYYRWKQNEESSEGERLFKELIESLNNTYKLPQEFE